MFSNTTARPRCRIRAGLAADGLRTAPSGARLPRRTAMPPSAVSALSSGRMTSASKTSAACAFLPQRAARNRECVAVDQPGRASLFSTGPRPPAAKKSSMRNRPDGIRSTIVGTPRPRRSQSSSVSGTPIRPAMASRCRTALVEPPIAPLTRIAFSNARRVRIFEQTKPFPHHTHDTAAGGLRQHPATRVDRRDRRVARQAQAQRLHHAGHAGSRAHGVAAAGRAAHRALGGQEAARSSRPDSTSSLSR